jgi:cytosine deaminase
MLVLSRQRDQSVMIGEDTEVRVIDVRGDKVRLGFVAPRDVSVHRKEVFDAIRRENRAAGQVMPADLKGLVPLGPSAGAPRNSNMRIVSGTTGGRADAAVAAAADPFLRAAIDEARAGLAEGGLPIGSVLVRDGQIVGRGHNRRVQRGDPMAHAEIDCLTQAGRQKTYRDTVLYSTLMPCFLCSGAVVQFGIKKVIVGERANFPGGQGPSGCSPDFLRAHGVEVVDLDDPECVDMMSTFIRDNPTLWNEDIGR